MSKEKHINGYVEEEIEVDPKDILPLPGSSRGKIDLTKESGWESLRELAESIKKDGILQRLLVIPSKYEGKYYAVFGYRRAKAAVLAGLKKIKVRLIRDLPPEKAVIYSFKENYNRKNLSDLEICTVLYNAYKKLREENPDLPKMKLYAKIGETYGVGGESEESKAKRVYQYLEQYSFIEDHRKTGELPIDVQELSEWDTRQIRSAAREIIGKKPGYEDEDVIKYEKEIMRTIAEEKVPVKPLVETLKREIKQGAKITPRDAAKIVKSEGFKTTENKQYVAIEIPPRIVGGLRKFEEERNPGVKFFAWGLILLDVAELYLKERGYIDE